jgi:hypothetical protein
MVVAPDSTWWCTALSMAVYITTDGANPSFSTSRPSPAGHRPRGGDATEQGMAVPAPTLPLGLDQPIPPRVVVH